MTKQALSWFVSTSLIMVLLSSGTAWAQLSDTTTFLAHVSNEYRVVPNLTYHEANNHENTLDLYLPRNARGPTPVLLYIHGGGWIVGNKESNVLRLLPYLEMGWAVVNVSYRLVQVSPAPAAVEDCLCALRWVAAHAEQYNLDSSRIVTSGNSAGGHLALTTGMIPSSAGLDRECTQGGFADPAVDDPVRVAAIINWYGITDVADLLSGPDEKGYAVRWLGGRAEPESVAKRVSPLTYVRKGLPPILTIHGDADPLVPYQHAVQLQDKLKAVGVPNELHTVAGGGHGNFNKEDTVLIYQTIRHFLAEHDLWSEPLMSQGRE